MTRLLAAAALAAAAALPVAAGATECTPRGCSAACYVNWDATTPADLVKCYS